MSEPTIKEKVLAVLSEGARPLSTKDLTAAIREKFPGTGPWKDSVHAKCLELLKDNQLDRDGENRWFVPSKVSAKAREVRNRLFGIGQPPDFQKLLNEIGDGRFWKSLVKSEEAGDLMLCALQRLFERLRETEDGLEEAIPKLQELQIANEGLKKEIENQRESARLLRKQRDDALSKATERAFKDHNKKK